MPGKKSKALPYLLLSTLSCLALVISPLKVSADANSDLQNSRSELNQMQSDLQSLNHSYQTTLDQARQTEQQVSNLMAKNKALHQEIAKMNQQIQDRNQLFKERIRVMYEEGNVSYLSVLLDSKDFSDFVDRLDMLTLIAQQDKNLIAQLQTEHATLETQQTQLTAQQHDLETKQNQLWALESTLQTQMKDKQSQIATKQQEVQQNEQAVAAAQEAAQQALIQQNTGSSQSSLSSRGEVSLSPSAPYMMMVATAYTAPQNSYTASGSQVGVGTVAVDPSVIPLGTKLYIEGYGYAIAADTGDAIKGNRIDLFFNSIDQCIFFGRQVVKVYKVS